MDDNGDKDDGVIQRPSNAILIQPNACICRKAKFISSGSQCEEICAKKQDPTNETATLYFNVELTTAITLDVYKDFAGWCGSLEGEDTVNDCLIEFKDQDGNTYKLGDKTIQAIVYGKSKR